MHPSQHFTPRPATWERPQPRCHCGRIADGMIDPQHGALCADHAIALVNAEIEAEKGQSDGNSCNVVDRAI